MHKYKRCNVAAKNIKSTLIIDLHGIHNKPALNKEPVF